MQLPRRTGLRLRITGGIVREKEPKPSGWLGNPLETEKGYVWIHEWRLAWGEGNPQGERPFLLHLHNLMVVDAGFRPEGVLGVNLDLRRAGYTKERRPALYRDLLQQRRSACR